MAPGRKFCTSTSACATSFVRTSRPASLLMSIDSDRLPRFEEMNSAENSPPLSIVARLRRGISPPLGSILRMPPPGSARNIVANGPDTTPVRSSTRTPLSGPGMMLSLSCLAAGQLDRFATFARCPRAQDSILSGPGLEACRLLHDFFFYITQLILAKKHLPTDEECWRTEGSPLDRIAGIFDQLFLDIVLLGAGDEPVDVDAGGNEGFPEDLKIIHLLRFSPHMVIGGPEIWIEHVLEPGRDGATHQHQRIDRKERIVGEFRNVMAADEKLRFQRLIFGLFFDAAKRLERRHVVGRLEYPSEQHRDIFEFHAGALFDSRNGELRQIGIRAAEIELKFDFQGTCHRTPPLRPFMIGVANRRGCRQARRIGI